MKKILATMAIAALSASAFAGVTLEGRYDYASDTFNTTGSSNNTSVGGFLWNYAKMGFSGKVADSVTVKAKFNFISGSALHVNGKDVTVGTMPNGITYTNAAGSQASSFSADLVESLEVSQKISDSFTATFGKLSNPGMSGFEGQTPTMYQYFTSQGYAFPRVTGASFNYELAAGQNLIFAFFNGTAAYATDSTRTGYGLVYSGTFGNFGLMANYHMDPQGASGTTSKDNTYTTVGLSYKMDAWYFTFDYDMNVAGKAATSGNDKKVNAAVLSAKYDMGNGWTPYLKIESTSKVGYTGSASKDYTDNYTTFALAGDYKAADNFMYHIAYVSKSTAYDSQNAYANATVAETLAYAGITYTGDFMK